MTNTDAILPNTQALKSIDIPPRWLECLRKSNLIAGKFVAFKTPLDGRYKNEIPIEKRWTCNMLIKHMKDDKKNLGLIIDLTNTDRYYNGDDEFTKNNIRYEKISCQGIFSQLLCSLKKCQIRTEEIEFSLKFNDYLLEYLFRHDITPSDKQINSFIQICNDFINNNPNDIIGVHCTHGFNRTGFLICAYLCQQLSYSIHDAIDAFTKARSPGIHKKIYLDTLIEKFGTGDATLITPPALSNFENNRKRNETDMKQPSKRFRNDKAKNFSPRFAVDLMNVIPISHQRTLDGIRLKCQSMCGWNRNSFPGSQPVSMDYTNYQSILLSDYMVSWKADGTRYMMLIEDEHRVYLLDRNNDVFQVHHMCFPKDSEYTKHLINTLVDGEFVIDDDNGIKRYRYLIYDIIVYDNKYVGEKSFKQRLNIIQNDIVNVRNDATHKGRIEKSLEPFSIRSKGFWDLSTTSKLFEPKFRSQISHGCDGLVFQPVSDPYLPGRALRVLKWKEDNTIDFLLKIERIGESSEKSALLYLNGMLDPFASIRYTPELDQYKNQIIECSYRNNEWYFYRFRTDKTYPNSRITADGTISAIQHPITKDYLCSAIEENIAFANH